MKRIQFGGDEVVQAKDGAGSATLSMAYGMSRAPCSHAEHILDQNSTDPGTPFQPRPSSPTSSSAPLAVRRVL